MRRFSRLRCEAPTLKSPAGGRHQIWDVGTDSEEPCDYPDFAEKLGRHLVRRRAARGILLCGTGIGMAMAANKIQGIRAGVAWNPAVAALTAEHNHANVLCIPARFVSAQKAQEITRAFLTTGFSGGRHARRVHKIRVLDKRP